MSSHTVTAVLPVSKVPLVAVIVLAPAAIALANLIALAPGRIAARVRPASVLKAE